MAAKSGYVAFGPVYPTILKQMKQAQQGLERITDWKRRVAPLPLVVIGGLNVDRLRIRRERRGANGSNARHPGVKEGATTLPWCALQEFQFDIERRRAVRTLAEYLT